MQVTLREMGWLRLPFLIWLAVTAVAAMAGPFGTIEAMGLGGRVAYWGAVTAGSIAMSMAAYHVAQRFGRVGSLLVWIGFLLGLSVVVHGANSLLFAEWSGLAHWLSLAGNVIVVAIAVHLLAWAVEKRSPDVEAPQPTDVFQKRLPIDVRAPLVRIEAQDHYLNVVTTKGSTLILMRLGDAISELSGLGLQVHRSHWIALDAVQKHRRDKGRDLMVMKDGHEVPVSRSFRPSAQDAGLF